MTKFSLLVFSINVIRSICYSYEKKKNTDLSLIPHTQINSKQIQT